MYELERTAKPADQRLTARVPSLQALLRKSYQPFAGAWY